MWYGVCIFFYDVIRFDDKLWLIVDSVYCRKRIDCEMLMISLIFMNYFRELRFYKSEKD